MGVWVCGVWAKGVGVGRGRVGAVVGFHFLIFFEFFVVFRFCFFSKLGS